MKKITTIAIAALMTGLAFVATAQEAYDCDGTTTTLCHQNETYASGGVIIHEGDGDANVTTCTSDPNGDANYAYCTFDKHITCEWGKSWTDSNGVYHYQLVSKQMDDWKC